MTPPVSRAALAIALVTMLAACASTHPESPALDEYPPGISGSTDVSYYDVHGRTAAELVAQMRLLGPKSTTGSFFGETQSPLRWDWRTKQEGSSCRIAQAHVHLHSEITLPRWTPPADTVPGLYKQWKDFLTALELHEVGHKDISARNAAAMLKELRGVDTFCKAINTTAKGITDAIMKRTHAEQAQYDADTRHGGTQGATFPGDVCKLWRRLLFRVRYSQQADPSLRSG